jgi:lipopolysaccharide transport system ATP-binding protein
MRKREIQRKLEEIVDFAGIERYLDTPVKRYSSGMYVRLAFAVAAHLESEILIVDEVLAVGDAEFQKKCLGKMGEVSKGEGRTVLFVSHNMDSISALTEKALYLNNGRLEFFGVTQDSIACYSSVEKNTTGIYSKLPHSTNPSITRVEVLTSSKGKTHLNGEDLVIDLIVNMPSVIEGMSLSLQICNDKNIPIIYTYVFDTDKPILRQIGENKMRCIIPNCLLYLNTYFLIVHLAETKGKAKFEQIEGICEFEVVMQDKQIEWGWQRDVCTFTQEFVWR